MKLESYWLFKKFFWCSAIPLVVSRGYILLISSPMLKIGKLYTYYTASYTCNFLKKLLQGGKNNEFQRPIISFMPTILFK